MPLGQQKDTDTVDRLAPVIMGSGIILTSAWCMYRTAIAFQRLHLMPSLRSGAYIIHHHCSLALIFAASERNYKIVTPHTG